MLGLVILLMQEYTYKGIHIIKKCLKIIGKLFFLSCVKKAFAIQKMNSAGNNSEFCTQQACVRKLPSWPDSFTLSSKCTMYISLSITYTVKSILKCILYTTGESILKCILLLYLLGSPLWPIPSQHCCLHSG